MHLNNTFDHSQPRWLAFELSVLRRLKFRSVAIPFAGEPGLEMHLKRWSVRISSNDAAHWAWTKAVALVENNTEILDERDVQIILDDAYVPRFRLSNRSLQRRFSEADAWWFDNVRQNVENLDGPVKQALALMIGMAVGDYALSFNEETREYRQPLSRVFRRLWEIASQPINNEQKNRCTHLETREFIAEQSTDLLFLRLPLPRHWTRARNSPIAWREEWVRGDDAFWDEFEGIGVGRLGAAVETKQQYLYFVEELLERAAHLQAWAIAHVESGFVSTEELVETIRRIRRVETIYTKDFTELTGSRAAIITAL